MIKSIGIGTGSYVILRKLVVSVLPITIIYTFDTATPSAMGKLWSSMVLVESLL